MDVNMELGWQSVLGAEMGKAYFKDLMTFVDSEYASAKCFPPKDEIFAAFNATPFDQVKVVIIGQDPYHGAGQANGLCFSVSEGVKLPPSLTNIFREMQSDLQADVSESGNLMHWAKQGVFLLNAILTVRESNPGSHQKKGWEQFTDNVILKLSEEKEGIVFLLWGGYAKKKGLKIDRSKHLILESGHPSPLSANRGHWFGNNHFSEVNKYLILNKKEPISWF